MKPNNRLLGVASMFLVFAIVFAGVIWKTTSPAAVIGCYACGFGSGAAMGAWIVRRTG